jgi:hypothetical protein
MHAGVMKLGRFQLAKKLKPELDSKETPPRGFAPDLSVTQVTPLATRAAVRPSAVAGWRSGRAVRLAG